jgi:hypothetical protein
MTTSAVSPAINVLFDICDKAVATLKGQVTSEPFAVEESGGVKPDIILLSTAQEQPSTSGPVDTQRALRDC